MKEISHSDLITKVRNSEGEVFVRVGEEDFCCNPTDDTRKDMAERNAYEDEQVAEASEDDTTDADGQPNPPDADAGDNTGDTPADPA